MAHTRIRFAAFFCAAVLAASCSDNINPSADLTFGIRHDVPLEDYENLAATPSGDVPDFSSVIFFAYSLDGTTNYDYLASGVLIDEQWILTAGHNFYDSVEQTNPGNPSGIQVRIGHDPNAPDTTFGVAEIVFHPTWLAGDQEFAHANDLCLVKLANPVSGATFATLHSSNNESVGSLVYHAGFGDYTSLSGQDPDAYSKKHAVQNVLDRVTDGMETTTAGTTYEGGLVAFDFDHPDGGTNTLGDQVINDDEFLLGSGSSDDLCLSYEGATVQGDSGGPLFLKYNGKWEVIGILSGGASEPVANHRDSDYGDISIYTRVSTAYSWIQEVIQ